MRELLLYFNKKSKDQPESLKRQDAVLSKNISVKNFSATKENINTTVFACPGSGVKRSYLYPNMLQTNSSFVVMDYKREIYNAMKVFLKRNGYKIQILDVEKPLESDGYNPLQYCKTTYDVENLVDCFKLPKGDSFSTWVLKKICYACIAFLTLNAPEETVPYCQLPSITGKNFYKPNPTLSDFFFMLEMAFSGNDKDYWSFVDLLKRIKHYESTTGKGYSYCLSNFVAYHNCSDAVKAAIYSQMSTILDNIKEAYPTEIANNDGISIESFGTEKVAVFVNIPHVSQERLYLVRMFLYQVYSVLFRFSDKLIGSKKIVMPNGELVKWIPREEANSPEILSEIIKEYQDVTTEFNSYKGVYNVYSGKRNKITSFPSPLITKKYVCAIKRVKVKDCIGCALPIPVRVFLNDIDIIGEIPYLINYMTVFRGVNISTIIITQSIDELKRVYGDHAQIILENCAYWLYMGASSPDRCEFLEDRIKLFHEYKSNRGKLTNLGYNYSCERLFNLPTDEMIIINNQKGECWKDDKYVLEEHPNYKYLKNSNLYYPE